MDDRYDESYYELNSQNEDRLGNLFYANIIKKNFKFNKFLDFGCGVGFLLKRIEKFKGSFETYGYEVNNFAIEKSLQNTKNSKIYKTIDQIGSNIDLISMLHIVEHVKDDELSNIFAKIKKKLSKSGKILISTPAKNGLAHHIKKNQWIAYKDPTHINLKTYEEWLSYFKKEKFTIVSTYSDGLWDFPYGGFLNYFRYIKIYFFMFIQIFFGFLILNYNQGETFIFILRFDD